MVSDASKKAVAQKKAMAAAKRGGKSAAATSASSSNRAVKAANGMAALKLSDRTWTEVLASNSMSRYINEMQDNSGVLTLRFENGCPCNGCPGQIENAIRTYEGFINLKIMDYKKGTAKMTVTRETMENPEKYCKWILKMAKKHAYVVQPAANTTTVSTMPTNRSTTTTVSTMLESTTPANTLDNQLGNYGRSFEETRIYREYRELEIRRRCRDEKKWK